MKWQHQSVSGLRSRSGEKSSVLIFLASTVEAIDLEGLDVRFRKQERLFAAVSLKDRSRCIDDLVKPASSVTDRMSAFGQLL